MRKRVVPTFPGPRDIQIAALACCLVSLFLLPASTQAAFPGQNGKIAFTSDRDTAGLEQIYVMGGDGSDVQRLTSGASYSSNPAWSPDGTKIAFDSNRAGNAEVYVMNAGGGGITKLTNNAAADASPVWSPDGSKIAFSSNRDGNYEIYTMNADGTDQTNVTSNPAYDDAPDWSPDGSKIAFLSLRNGGQAEIFTMKTDGSAVTNLTNNTTVEESNPSWSPDGTKIAFNTFRDGQQEIYSMSANGTGRTRLTNNAVDIDTAPAWSPDGTKIAYEHFYDSALDYEVYVMKSDGTGQADVTNNAAFDVAPDWQPLPYSTPVGASPLRAQLVPAYQPCETTSANAAHGAPLNFPSCDPPRLISSTATIGPDSIGFVRYVVCAENASSLFCNPPAGVLPRPDVRLTGSVRDVICAQQGVPTGCVAGQDYNPNGAPGPYTDTGGGTTGASPPCFPSATSTTDCVAGADLTEAARINGSADGAVGTRFQAHGLRITDSDNGGRAGTMADVGFPIPLDCIPTASPTQGSVCGVNTTANALVAGVVKAGKASVWQIGELELRDSGRDGVRGNADDQPFAVQGIFLP